MKIKLLAILAICNTLGASDIDDAFDAFSDDSPTLEIKKDPSLADYGLSGKLTQQISKYFSSKTSLFLDLDKKFDNNLRLKINAKSDHYRNNGIDKLKDENELYDAYIATRINDSFDIKIGRQVVVWGRSDTIRVTDVLNPLDNRRPAMVDIEDLRLPVTMAKLDYFFDNWKLSTIALLEQRFSKNPSLGSIYYPLPYVGASDKKYHDITMALSLGAEFSSWDITFYGANLRQDSGYYKNAKIEHDKINMLGSAFNILNGSWLFKSEIAYFNALKFSQTQDKKFDRLDALMGFEYKGIADTTLSYDISIRKLFSYDAKLNSGYFPILKESYQHALRMSSDLLNATLHVNYLFSPFGEKMDKGGFQRAWIKYDINDRFYTNIGIVDYIGGMEPYESIKESDMLFAELTFSF